MDRGGTGLPLEPEPNESQFLELQHLGLSFDDAPRPEASNPKTPSSSVKATAARAPSPTTPQPPFDSAAQPPASLLPSTPRMRPTKNPRLERLVREHIGFVERVLRNLGVPEAELDDAVQRTFIVVGTRLNDIREGAEKSFLFKSARHLASHVRRSQRRQRQMTPLDEELPAVDEGPEELTSQKRAREALDHILDGMPDDLRTVFALYEFEQLRTPEIAALLDIPGGTVASRLRRAREHFQAQIKRMESAAKHRQSWKLSS